VQCEICQSKAITPSFTSVRGAVLRCLDCGVYFVDDNELTPQEQEKLFYSTIDERKYTGYFELFRKRQYYGVLESLKLKRGSSHLDVGASYGWMVEVGLDLGLDSYGLEPGDARYKRALTGRIIRASLQDYVPRRSFDLVTIWHVLEHLPEPAAAIQQLANLVADGGRLVIAVPTAEGRMFKLGLLTAKLFKSTRILNELFYFHNPNMHFFYYTENSVRELLRQVGLTVVTAQTIEAFDWTTIAQRVDSPVRRTILRLAGPFLAWSRFTSLENLIVVARK
jgi:SAM-dependent methyltransferase